MLEYNYHWLPTYNLKQLKTSLQKNKTITRTHLHWTHPSDFYRTNDKAISTWISYHFITLSISLPQLLATPKGHSRPPATLTTACPFLEHYMMYYTQHQWHLHLKCLFFQMLIFNTTTTHGFHIKLVLLRILSILLLLTMLFSSTFWFNLVLFHLSFM